VNITSTSQVSLSFTNNRLPGSVTVHKQDDAGNPLGGVKLTLYTDNTPFGPPDGNGTNQDSHGNEDTANASLTCTTATQTTQTETKGDCTISNVSPGKYWVVEDPTTVPSGYAVAADGYATVSAGSSVQVTMTDPRLHRYIVLVCHEGTNSLYASTVDGDGDLTTTGDQKTSIGSVPSGLAGKGVTAAELCGLGGAQFGSLGHGNQTPKIVIASH
jgi:uncharacterized surface anchored protein